MINGELLLFLAAALSVNLSTGPSVLYVASVAASSALRAAVVSVLGMSVGIFVHVLAAATGVAALLNASSVAFTLLKYAGAAYLVYLGLRLWYPAGKQTHAAVVPGKAGPRAFFRRGMLVDLFNPKIGVCSLAFLPQFVGAASGDVFTRTLAFGSVFVLTGAIVNTGIAVATTKGKRWVTRRARPWLERWLPGGILVGLGVRLALAER